MEHLSDKTESGKEDLIWVSSLQEFHPRNKANAILSYKGPRKAPRPIAAYDFPQRKQYSRKGTYRSH